MKSVHRKPNIDLYVRSYFRNHEICISCALANVHYLFSLSFFVFALSGCIRPFQLLSFPCYCIISFVLIVHVRNAQTGRAGLGLNNAGLGQALVLHFGFGFFTGLGTYLVKLGSGSSFYKISKKVRPKTRARSGLGFWFI
jgi:hypothetical protein